MQRRFPRSMTAVQNTSDISEEGEAKWKFGRNRKRAWWVYALHYLRTPIEIALFSRGPRNNFRDCDKPTLEPRCDSLTAHSRMVREIAFIAELKKYDLAASDLYAVYAYLRQRWQ